MRFLFWRRTAKDVNHLTGAVVALEKLMRQTLVICLKISMSSEKAQRETMAALIRGYEAGEKEYAAFLSTFPPDMREGYQQIQGAFLQLLREMENDIVKDEVSSLE